METFAKSEWEVLCLKYTSDGELIKQLWHELAKAYTAKNRHYHTLDHIAHMLQLAIPYKQSEKQYDLLLFAIFYHDAVYSATRSDNEAQSAALAEKRLISLGLPEADIAFVKEMIVATKAHQQHTEPIINLLLDLDLAILGADREKYKAYTRAIRKEYSIYPDLLYKPGRKKVLQHFLQQPAIYKTIAFRQAYEERSRLNLQWELDSYT
jgi:predicted metal-dependent HD superfamily phosphohydrolase